MLLQTVRSGNSHCLEGTHIATIDGDETILSSGFEDYYLSGQYFDAGPFATPISGSETPNAAPLPWFRGALDALLLLFPPWATARLILSGPAPHLCTTRPAAWRSSWLCSDTLVVWRQ